MYLIDIMFITSYRLVSLLRSVHPKRTKLVLPAQRVGLPAPAASLRARVGVLNEVITVIQ